jgi:hypothetical protein
LYFTKVLKGISASKGLDRATAESMLKKDGILCNWWKRVHRITPAEIAEKLSDRTLYWHLERYEDPLPPSLTPFSQDTPYVSTTAGVVERDWFLARNLVRPAFLTALHFATDGYTKTGYVFCGYVITLGRKAIPFTEYAEEVRELNVYTSYLQFHDEGEIVAKIEIPAHRLERVDEFDGPRALVELRAGQRPVPTWSCEDRSGYSVPENYANIRDVLR